MKKNKKVDDMEKYIEISELRKCCKDLFIITMSDFHTSDSLVATVFVSWF